MSKFEYLSGQMSNELLELLDRVCDGEATAQDSERLSMLLIGNRELQRIALRYLDLHSTLQWRWRGGRAMSSADSTSAMICFAINSLDSELDDFTETEVLPAMRPPPPPKTPSRFDLLMAALRWRARRAWAQLRSRMWRQPRRGWAEGMVGLAVVVLVAMLLLMPMPPEVPVADVVESANAHWSQAGIRPAAGRMAPGTYDLDRGAIKLRTTTGVEVNLEAPCQFRLRGANQLHLDFGVLYAEARGSDPDFTVLTPTALVHDLGTAFGVEVDQAGSTEAVVMEGKVAMSTPGARPEQSVVIPKDYRSRVLADAGVVEPVKEIINPHVFERYPRKVLQRVWLASLLCEQTSGNLMDCHCGLNVTNGESLTWEQRITSPDAGDWERESDGAYIETPQLAAIDGVFVPNPNGVIDRTGRTFEQFNTANRIWTFGDVWVGRPFPMRVGFVNEHRDRLDRAGIGRYAISMHAPKGITVDLQQVSALNGNLTPKRFKASLFNYGDHDSQPNIWVIIDGQLVYHNPGLKTQDGIVPVEIELPHGAQYLTLAATVDEPFCWVAIDQAVFELGTSPAEEQ